MYATSHFPSSIIISATQASLFLPMKPTGMFTARFSSSALSALKDLGVPEGVVSVHGVFMVPKHMCIMETPFSSNWRAIYLASAMDCPPG